MASVNLLHYIDPFTSFDAVTFDGKSFQEKESKKFHIGSRISYEDIIHHSFKVAANISEEELKSSVEIRMYEDAGLDVQKEYKITYVKKELDFDEMILVEAFAIENESVQGYLEPIAKKKKHIDFIALPFLVFSTLYKRKIVAPKDDIFIYLGEQEAFVTLYKDGKYLSAKSIPTLEDMKVSLMNIGINMDTQEILEHLSNKGLEPTVYERTEVALFNEIESFFSQVFTKINDVIVYNRSIFGFESAQRIFLSTKLGRIKGLKAFIENFGITDVKVLDFNLFKEKAEENFFERIVAAYIYEKLEEDDFEHSLNLFEREAPFYKKESGQALFLGIFIVFFSFLYVGSLWFETKELLKEKQMLTTQYNAMKKNASRYKQQVNETKKSLAELKKEQQTQKGRYTKAENSVAYLENLKNKNNSFSTFILQVHSLLKEFDLSVTTLELKSANLLHVQIVAPAKKRDNITRFMKALVKEGFVGITTDEILSNEEVYMSNVVVQR